MSEWLPNICPHGHRLIAPNVLVGWTPCACQPDRMGHRTVTCRECGATWFKPPHVDDGKASTSWQ
jgi:hypothetical protein